MIVASYVCQREIISPRVCQRNAASRREQIRYTKSKVTPAQNVRPYYLLLGECRTQCERAARVLATSVIETIVGIFQCFPPQYQGQWLSEYTAQSLQEQTLTLHLSVDCSHWKLYTERVKKYKLISVRKWLNIPWAVPSIVCRSTSILLSVMPVNTAHTLTNPFPSGTLYTDSCMPTVTAV